MALTAAFAEDRASPPLRPLRRVLPYVLRYPRAGRRGTHIADRRRRDAR